MCRGVYNTHLTECFGVSLSLQLLSDAHGHLGAGHTTAETSATAAVTFTVTAKNVANRTHAIILFSEQREDGVYRVVVDLSVLAVSASRCPWTSQESSSRQFVCCSSPAG